ncbi:MAG: tetratricopeptide repeat protein [Pseudomonadota bacterium]
MIRRVSLLLAGFLLTTLPGLAEADKDRDPIVVQDAHYGEVLFHFYQDDYFPAIVKLLAAQNRAQVGNHIDDAELLLGGMFLSYGHHLEAAEIFERLLADNVDEDIRNRTWFFLAKIWSQRGYLEESKKALDKIDNKALPKNLQREANMLHAQLLIDSGDYGGAVAMLDDWKGRTEWASYARFNLGVALVRNGQLDQAKSILDDLGDMNPFNEELTSLRDKANLALGYALLQAKQSDAAKAPLQRVRLEGPFSNKALLGVGWADAEQERFDRALVPWMELRSRDLLDPAVQESMLAIPYALAQLDSVSQAADHYLNAIEAFYEESNRIDTTIGHLESGDFFDDFVQNDPLDSTGWYWQMQELPQGPEARYLFHLLATHEFQEGLKSYRDLNYLYRNLESWEDNIEVYANMLETRRTAYQERLPRTMDALDRADIDALINRKLEFDAQLNDIEQNGDWLALANKYEFQLWGEITGYEANPALQANIPEAEDVRRKVALLKGALQWNLERDFKDRLWRIRRDLRKTGEALVETQRARRKVDDSMREQPLEFDAFGDRVYGLEPRILGMKLRVADAMAEQRAFLQSIAVGELQAQKERLDIYTVQARFALAAIYDRAATVGENVP